MPWRDEDRERRTDRWGNTFGAERAGSTNESGVRAACPWSSRCEHSGCRQGGRCERAAYLERREVGLAEGEEEMG